MSPIDTAVYWTEYIIRNGKNALRSPGINLAWWQIALLDVYGFFLLCILVILYLIYILSRLVANIIFIKNEKANVSKKLR